MKKILALLAVTLFASLAPCKAGDFYYDGTTVDGQPVAVHVGADGNGSDHYYYVELDFNEGPLVISCPAYILDDPTTIAFHQTLQQFLDANSPVPVQLP